MTDSPTSIKPIAAGERRVANLDDMVFEPFVNEDGDTDGFSFQHDRDRPLGTGFHIYKMAPGQTTIPHRHNGHEEFFLISGDLTDNDGTEYRPGDLVWLQDGTEHCSYSKNGCLLVVYIPQTESSLG